MKLFEVFAEIGLKSEEFLAGLKKAEAAAEATMEQVKASTYDAGKQVGEFFSGVGQSISQNEPETRERAYEMGRGIAESLREAFAAAREIGGDFVSGLKNGIEEAENSVLALLRQFGRDALYSMKGYFNRSEGGRTGRYFAEGITEGLNNASAGPIGAVAELGRQMLAKMRAIFGVNSPAREGIEIGGYLGDGVTSGLLHSMGDAVRAARKYGSEVKKDLYGSIGGGDIPDAGLSASLTGTAAALRAESPYYSCHISVDKVEVAAEDLKSADDVIKLFTGLKEAKTAYGGV